MEKKAEAIEKKRKANMESKLKKMEAERNEARKKAQINKLEEWEGAILWESLGPPPPTGRGEPEIPQEVWCPNPTL